MKFIVIAQNNDTQTALVSAIEDADNVAIPSSLSELPALLKEQAVSGIIIDMITATRSTAQEKQETNELIQLFPNLKVKLVKNELVCLGKGISIMQFVQNCRSFTPRTIRKGERKVRHIAFLLSADNEFSKPEKTVTLNIADKGCFVYSTGEWKPGDRVWLRFIDNDNVITGIVRWWQPWGNSKKMPGIGISFD